MSTATKRCTGCGQDKPRSEFYVAHKATPTRKAKIASRCKDCMNTRPREVKQDQPRINRNRARHRAIAALIERHQAEFDALYEQRLVEAEEEAEALAADQAAREHYRDEPVRLRPGQRRKGEKAGDRIDVARCPHCVKHHDRGHVCAVCGAAPSEPTTNIRNAKRVTQNTSRKQTRRATNQILDSRNQSADSHLNEQASQVANLPISADAAQVRSPSADEQANEQATCSSDDRLSDRPRRTRIRPRVYDGLGLPRKPPPHLDLNAIAEFNAGVERARKAAR